MKNILIAALLFTVYIGNAVAATHEFNLNTDYIDGGTSYSVSFGYATSDNAQVSVNSLANANDFRLSFAYASENYITTEGGAWDASQFGGGCSNSFYCQIYFLDNVTTGSPDLFHAAVVTVNGQAAYVSSTSTYFNFATGDQANKSK